MLINTFIIIPTTDFFGARMIASGRDNWLHEVIICCIANEVA